MEKVYHLPEIEDNQGNNHNENKMTLNSSKILVLPLNLLEREVGTCWGGVKILNVQKLYLSSI